MATTDLDDSLRPDRWTLLTFEAPLGSGEVVAEWLWDLGTMLDVGTGNGVLSLAAIKLHPAIRVTALDNDPTAIEVASETLARNGIPPTAVSLVCGEPAALSGCFDLVAANLTLAILQRTASDLVRIAGSLLLLSGFTSDQQPLTLELFQDQFEVEEANELNGWASLILRRRKASLSAPKAGN